MNLVGAITSDYFSAANRLSSKSARRRIVAYVESYDDVFFWRMLLSQAEDDKHYYEVLLPTQRGKLGRGKKCVLKMIRSGRLGNNMIACVDADYDYLIQGFTDHSRQMLYTPYVFHTHAYAIENWMCWAPSLHQVAVMVTLNDKRIFDYQAYLHAYSRIVYPLFVWSVHLYRNELFSMMSLNDMDRAITPGRFCIEHPEHCLLLVQQNTEMKLQELQKLLPDFTEHEQQALAQELSTLGVTPDNCYLYIHGHHLFEKVVTPMLTNICNRLRHIRENDIRTQAVHQTQLNAELAGYTHATEAVGNMLRKNTAWLSAPIIQNLIHEIKQSQKANDTAIHKRSTRRSRTIP